MHARRAKPGFVSSRYFVDVSYCQPGRHRWPAYGDEQHHQINLKALALGHDRDGKYRGVWDDSIMYTRANADPETTAADERVGQWHAQLRKMQEGLTERE
jgi:hypothetical protein